MVYIKLFITQKDFFYSADIANFINLAPESWQEAHPYFSLDKTKDVS